VNNKDFELIKNGFMKSLEAKSDSEKIGVWVPILEGNYKDIFNEIMGDNVISADDALFIAHYISDLCINMTLEFFIGAIQTNCIDESSMEYFTNIKATLFERLIDINNEFGNIAIRLDTGDMSIKDFPENADKRDREILNELAKRFHIDRKLSPQNKYKLTRPIFCKQVVIELIKHGYNANSGLIFMNQYIDYHVEPTTIQNYFRICKKDMPIKK
jgi:chorismate mutase